MNQHYSSNLIVFPKDKPNEVDSEYKKQFATSKPPLVVNYKELNRDKPAGKQFYDFPVAQLRSRDYSSEGRLNQTLPVTNREITNDENTNGLL